MTKFARAQAGLMMMAGLLAVGCGFNLGDVDRTQPDKVKKAMFQDGKAWYFRQTIIDLPATSGISFIGEQGSTYKIIWQIDERFIYAYRAHEQLKGGEQYAQRPGVAYRGTPVAAFAIQSHFDVQREYNPSTGEQTNVISENMMDRPWNEREYMRVDWSNNLIADFTFGAATVAQQPVGRYVREGEADKDAAKITDGYLDIVHEIVAEPETVEFDYEGERYVFPTCYLYSSIYSDCLGSRTRIRSSFLKADESNGYEPLTFDDNKFSKFGYFRTDRFGYDRRYGVVDTAVDYLIERFPLWKQTKGETSCVDNSNMHPWAACPNSKLKPIVYYVNEDMPEYLKAGNARIGGEWNRVFKDAISAMTGRPLGELPDMFVMCLNNPVREGDPAECGAPGLNPQIGDLRYSFIWYVRGPQANSPLGYGPHAPDPETGEVISANSFIYGGALETYAQYALDFVKLQNGDLSVNDLFNGQNIVQHYQRVMENRATRDHRADAENWRAAADKLGIKQKAEKIREQLRRGQLSTDLIPGRLEKVRGTEYESMFFNEDMRRALLPQYASAADVPANMRSLMSPVTFTHPMFRRLHKEREFKLSMATIEPAEFFEDQGMQGLAKRLNCKLPVPTVGTDLVRRDLCDGDKLNEARAYQLLLEEIYVGVTLHEVGHNVGLRHNFAASTDSINYFPKYWELRSITSDGIKIKPQFNLTSSVERDLLNSALDQGMSEYMYSSIMDYGSKPNSDFVGLGLYDRAAVLYGYGQMVEVFNQDPATNGETVPAITRDTRELLLPIARHYTEYPNIISGSPTTGNGAIGFSERVDSMYRRKVLPESMVKANRELVEVPYRFCSDEYVNGVYFCYRFDSGADAYEQVKNNVDMYENYYMFNGMRRNRVGFGMNVWGYVGRIYGRYFEFQSAQNKHFLNDNLINRFSDAGCEQGVHFVDPKCGQDRFAAALEAASALGRVLQTPEPGCYVRRKPGCYEDSFETVNGLPASIQKRDAAFCAAGSTASRATLVKPTDSFALIENSVDCTAWMPLLTAGGSDIWEKPVELPLGVARFGLDKYNKDAYGYGFYWKPVAIGAWWDKWLAMQAFGDPYTDFIGVDSRGDARSFLISFNNLFRNDIASAVGSFITEDYAKYGPYVVDMETQPRVIFPDVVVNFKDALSNTPQPRIPANAIPLNPDEKYTTRLQALYIAVAYYSQMVDDQDFNQAMFIGKAGSQVDLNIPTEVRNNPDKYVEITDPVTGALYFATKNTPDASWFISENPFYSAGYEWVKKVRDANMTPDGKTLLPGRSADDVRQEIRMWEIVRGFLRMYGYGDAWGISY
jgi:hypothetical protein